MILKIILLLASTAALVLTFRTNSQYTNMIVFGMFASIILVQFPACVFTGIIIYMGFVAISFLYALLLKNKKIHAKLIIGILSASMFTYWLWMLNHWHGNTLLVLVLAFIAGIFGIVYRKDLKTEWGFLLILWIDSIDSILEQFLKSGIG